MKLHSTARLIIAGSFLVVMFGAAAQEGQAVAPSPAASAPAVSKSADSTKPAAAAVEKASPSHGIAEVLKMLDAGLSKEVIKTFVESSPTAYAPTATEVIALKDHGATDEIMTALLKRGAEIRSHAAEGVADPAAMRALLREANARSAGNRGLDPESYDYFSYYYLYPRTLASVNERLGFSPGAYPYNYYPPVGFAPYYSGGSPQPRRFAPGGFR